MSGGGGRRAAGDGRMPGQAPLASATRRHPTSPTDARPLLARACAAEELKAAIREKYPDAEFRLSKAGNDRYIWHLWTTVDIEDPEEMKELIRERELDMQDVEHIPLHVITLGSDRVSRHLPNRVNGKQV